MKSFLDKEFIKGTQEKSEIKVSVHNSKPPEGWYKNYICLYDCDIHNFKTISHSVSKWLKEKFEDHDYIYIENLDGESDLMGFNKILYIKRVNLSELTYIRLYPQRYGHLINLSGKSLEELDLLVYKDKLIEFDGEIEIQEGRYGISEGEIEMYERRKELAEEFLKRMNKAEKNKDSIEN